MEHQSDLTVEEHREETESVISCETGTDMYSVIQILENFILLGVATLDKWEKVLDRIKVHVDVVDDVRMFNLYVYLAQIFNAFSTKCYEQVYSQEKLPLVRQKEMTYKEVMQYLPNTLKKKTFKEKTVSLECTNKIMSIVRSILESLQKNETPDKPDKPLKVKRKRSHAKGRPSKKARTESSCSSSSSSSASSSSSDSSDTSDSDSGSDDSVFDKVKIKKHIPLIKQIYQTQKRGIRKRIGTPGETGRFLIKMEITDVKDLKKCKSYKTYWTQVYKKTLFLTDKNDEVFKNVNQIMTKAGKKIASVKGVESQKIKLSEVKKN